MGEKVAISQWRDCLGLAYNRRLAYGAKGAQSVGMRGAGCLSRWTESLVAQQQQHFPAEVHERCVLPW